MTDSEVIDFLGGTCKLAREIKVDPRVVSNWRVRKTGISGVGRFKIRDLARRKRIKLPEGFMESMNG